MPKHPRSSFYDEHTKALLRYHDHLLEQRLAKQPGAPIAEAIYQVRPKGGPNNSRVFEYDHRCRGGVSPLGGVAQPATATSKK